MTSMSSPFTVRPRSPRTLSTGVVPIAVSVESVGVDAVPDHQLDERVAIELADEACRLAHAVAEVR